MITPPAPPVGHASESTERQGQTLHGYLTSGPRRNTRDRSCPGTYLIFLPWVLLAAWPWSSRPDLSVSWSLVWCQRCLIFVLRSLCVSGIGWHSPFRSRLPLPATDPLSPSLPLPFPLSFLSLLWLALTHTQRNLTERNLSSSLRDLLLQFPPLFVWLAPAFERK